MWFNTLKGYRANYNPGYYGSIPQFYHYLKRIFRPASEQTPQYLKQRMGWDELDDETKLWIKMRFDEMELYRLNNENSQNWIPGISVDFDDLNNPVVNEAVFEEWRKDTQTKGEDVSGFHYQAYRQRPTYKVIEAHIARKR